MGAARGGRLTATNVTLKYLILWAWDLRPYQISGGPPWLDSSCYDIIATPEHPVRSWPGQHRNQQANDEKPSPPSGTTSASSSKPKKAWSEYSRPIGPKNPPKINPRIPLAI